MGGCFSCGSSCTFNTVRVVHLNGYVENYEQPITVRQVTGNTSNPSKHFVCTPLELLSPSSKPLKGDTLLQRGQVYFVLPYSILQADASPVDMACLVKRLTAMARTNRCGAKRSPSMSPVRGGVAVAEQVSGTVTYGGRGSCKVRPWKPILDTIREKSFNRRSESDLQEND